MRNAAVSNPAFADELRRLEPEIGQVGPLWLRRLQGAAFERFMTLGLPTPQDEQWRQTSISPIAATAYRRTADRVDMDRRDLDRIPLADLGCPRLVFVDGRFAAHLSRLDGLSAGIRVGSLRDALAERPQDVQPHLGAHANWQDRSFAALNTALFEDGALVIVPRGADLERPLHILHVGSSAGVPRVSSPRCLVLVGEQARISIAETFAAPDGAAYFTNAVTEIVVGAGSEVAHWRVQCDAEQAHHVGALDVHQARDSRFRSLNASLGAALTRNDISVVLDGEGAECTLDGLYVARNRQHVDNHTTIDHARPHAVSHERYKGILAGSARAVFHGRIIVRKGSQQTDAKQSNRNLLLSGDAVVHTRPQLEIYADDVRCTHGATIGHLDEDSLFYLRSRGIGLAEARGVLIHAFAAGALGGLSLRSLREGVETEAAARVDVGASPGEAP